ncbi:peptidoglycan DD-metalloendopeptidase family protein [Pseudoalteromonas sp. SCSIO 43201]|uniref:murein hydrolase activator EnvC family protein n=1 Tax=Pseudoalteromonas sp. SCSIO 43201 TaxID=2822842 RepID=UPI002076126E|nr:peptidoglycan DD-metalloendopeptidase family protein [Pseudoalteromonas sp. SCSIO 43201]USD28020.1 peptidoglycan DD-metalloendopeptidase family protein [Pseudoalteromonas sp. SCSIO 43201]
MPLKTTLSYAALLSAALLMLIAPVSANESRTKQDLSEVQQQLKASQQALEKQRSTIKSQEAKLKAFELDIAKSAKAVSLTEAGIKENKTEQTTLERQKDALLSDKSKFEKQLAAQLKSAYMTGSHDYSRMLLNQEHATKLERTIAYYDYLNKARIEQLEQLKVVRQALANTQAELTRSQSQLEALRRHQKERLEALRKAKQARQSQLADLHNQLKETRSAIAYLKENEQTLIQTLAELAKAQQAAEIRLDGLAQLKGKLHLPAKGRIQHRFGQRKHAGMNWKGVLIGAKEGADITSVAPGQVVFADWLNGFGWVMVLDHGHGFMSLYGHAQTLLFDVGDQVRSGEVIALVGQSGGQRDPGLYFEIRHKGSAVDPIKWCRSS